MAIFLTRFFDSTAEVLLIPLIGSRRAARAANQHHLLVAEVLHDSLVFRVCLEFFDFLLDPSHTPGIVGELINSIQNFIKFQLVGLVKTCRV